MTALSVIGVDPGERSGAAARLVWDVPGRWLLDAWAVWCADPKDPRAVLVYSSAAPDHGYCVLEWLIPWFLARTRLAGVVVLAPAGCLAIEVARGGPKVHLGVHRARGAWRCHAPDLQHEDDQAPVDVLYTSWRALVGAPGTATAAMVTDHALQWADEEIEGFAASAKALRRKALRAALAEACAIAVVGAS